MKPELKVTVFSDYICPFCYVGDVRLGRLREHFDLKTSWCFLEIHPQTSPHGEALDSLEYPAEKWKMMMAGLEKIAAEEGLTFEGYKFTTNSRAALQLAEAVKHIDAEAFYRLHNSLFSEFFTNGENIGDQECLHRLALEAGLSIAQIDHARKDKAAAARIAQYRQAAVELKVQATPTFFIGEARLGGVVPFENMLSAARAAVSTGHDAPGPGDG